MFGLEGKNVLVLGGGQGMGESTSLRLASVGANVAVADLETERAERVAAELSEVGVRALPVSVDVTDDADLVATVRESSASWDRSTEWSPSWGWRVGHRSSTCRSNTGISITDVTSATSSWPRARSLLRSSAVAIRGHSCAWPRSTVFAARRTTRSYGAAKAGLINLVKSMSVEWASRGCASTRSLRAP